MKLLLTSGGLGNKSIISALEELTGKPFNQLNLAFIPTAANLEEGDKWFLIEDLCKCRELGFSTDIVDISALPKEVWLPRLEKADVIFIGGGNVYHLMYWVNKSGLGEVLPQLLKTRVYVGISAGTVIATSSIKLAEEEKPPAEKIGEICDDRGLGLVNFLVEPHINNHYFPQLTFEYVEKEARETSYPIYALDDNSAIKVIDNQVEIISEGEWKRFN